MPTLRVFGLVVAFCGRYLLVASVFCWGVLTWVGCCVLVWFGCVFSIVGLWVCGFGLW